MCTVEANGYIPGLAYSIIGVSNNGTSEFFKRIGQYDFTKKDKIDHLKKSWTPTDDVDGKDECYFDSREVIKKINELVEAVNRLKEKVNE